MRIELYNLCDQCSRLGSLNLLIDDCVNNNYWNFVLGSDSYKQLAYERWRHVYPNFTDNWCIL